MYLVDRNGLHERVVALVNHRGDLKILSDEQLEAVRDVYHHVLEDDSYPHPLLSEAVGVYKEIKGAIDERKPEKPSPLWIDREWED